MTVKSFQEVGQSRVQLAGRFLRNHLLSNDGRTQLSLLKMPLYPQKWRKSLYPTQEIRKQAAFTRNLQD